MRLSTRRREMAERTRRDPRWAAVLARDPAADGHFFYAVRSTGVYCRPACPARRARPENVTFHATGADARAAGFRPCRRCQPDEPWQSRQARQVTLACRRIETASRQPDLASLARLVGLSPFHFHRLFKATTGLTPRQYAQAHRARRLRGELAAGASVTRALHEAGYGSSSRMYEQSNALLGMTPASYRAGGARGAVRARIRFALAPCSLGTLLVAASELGICSIDIGDDPGQLRRTLQQRFPRAEFVGADAAFQAQVAQVVGCLEQPHRGLQLPLDVRGTAFQRRVWQALSQIRPGTTASYSQLARRIGKPRAVRAVAQACAANTLAVVIPCHRVIRRDGSLSGYRWGTERKRELLRREADAAEAP